eukprot:5076611-Pyramimonas_sp.AAC.1
MGNDGRRCGCGSALRGASGARAQLESAVINMLTKSDNGRDIAVQHTCHATEIHSKTSGNPKLRNRDWLATRPKMGNQPSSLGSARGPHPMAPPPRSFENERL